MLRAEGIEQYPVGLICQTIGITRSAYYNRKRHPQTAKEKDDERLANEAERLFIANRKEYGRIRLHKAMVEAGHRISEGKTRKLMQNRHLKPKKQRKYKAITNSRHKYKVADNLLKQDFKAEKPNRKWCGDSTFIRTDEGWLYAAGIIDLCDRSCVGLWIDDKHSQELMLNALESAYKEHKPKEGLIFHSDRGVQYAADAYKQKLKDYKMIQSMSRSGNPYDNAPMESFWSTVKTGCVLGVRFITKEAAKRAIYEYVFGFYNTKRYHTGIGLEVPVNYRQKMLDIGI